MMMPANFSAVAENEMTYVVGGSLVDYLAPVMEASNWSKFNQNMITVVGNNFVEKFLKKTIGQIFGGNYYIGAGVDAFGAENRDIWNHFGGYTDGTNGYDKFNGVLNIALNAVGYAAAIYNLGFGTVKNTVSESQFNTLLK